MPTPVIARKKGSGGVVDSGDWYCTSVPAISRPSSHMASSYAMSVQTSEYRRRRQIAVGIPGFHRVPA
eukprot:2306779-Rhodomonas_salina.1